jgi:hypothetical protein
MHFSYWGGEQKIGAPDKLLISLIYNISCAAVSLVRHSEGCLLVDPRECSTFLNRKEGGAEVLVMR